MLQNGQLQRFTRQYAASEKRILISLQAAGNLPCVLNMFDNKEHGAVRIFGTFYIHFSLHLSYKQRRKPKYRPENIKLLRIEYVAHLWEYEDTPETWEKAIKIFEYSTALHTFTGCCNL